MKKFIFSILIFITITALNAEWTVVSTYTIPGKASGLAWDGNYLYSGIYGSNGSDVYQIDPSDGSYQLQFTDPDLDDTYGLTHDGTNLWLTDHRNGASAPAVAYQYDMNGNIVSEFDLPDHYMSGIASDNSNFWVATYYPDDPAIVYQVDNAGSILQQFNFDIPGNNEEQPWDMCLQTSDLWIADYYADKLYKVDISGAILEEHNSESVKPAGIVFDGNFLWYVDGALGSNSTLYKVDLGGAGSPAISLGWDEYDFSTTIIGQPATVELPVNNAGSADLIINELYFTIDVFYSDESLPITIVPGGNTNITLFFDPAIYGLYEATLSVVSNDPVNPLEEITLSGFGNYATQEIEVSPLSVNFGDVRIGACSGEIIEISNLGIADLIIDDIQFDVTWFSYATNVQLPIILGENEVFELLVWFSPDSEMNFDGNMQIHNNDPDEDPVSVYLSGTGDSSDYPIGSILWSYQISGGYDNSPKAISYINDVSGDDIDDVIICSEDNFVYCFNGNSSGTADILWEHEIPSGHVYHQNSLITNIDLNGDNYADIIAGTVGGDKAVRAISGEDGQLLWIYNTNAFGNGGWIYQIDVSFDFNNDGTLDVLAATGNDSNGTGPQRVFCLDGSNGIPLWNFYVAGPKFSCIGVEDMTNDGIPDVIGGGSNSSESDGKVWGIDGSNGSQIWEFTTSGSSVWALSQVDDISGNSIKDVVAGDFSGNFYAIDTFNGSMIWNGSIGSGLIIRFETLNDVNGDGHPDIAIARSTQDNAIVIDGVTGDNIWLQPLADQPWVVDKIGDITGDGINDVVWGTLFGENYGYFMNGATGEIISQTQISSACDAIAGIPDIAGDGSWEMVCGGRNGEVICISGGETAPLGWIEGNVVITGGTGIPEDCIIEVGGNSTIPDADGYYIMFIAPGSYTLTATMEDYQDYIEEITVYSDQATMVNIEFIYLFSPQNLAYTIEENSVILEWEVPQSSREITSYKVYRDAEEIADISELTYNDENLPSAIYEYYITAIYEGTQESEPSNIVTIEITEAGNNLPPLVTKLNGNYPNPFNPITKISFDLAEDNEIILVIYNTKGQLVKTLVNAFIEAGYHTANWNGTDDQNNPVASGLYFYKMSVEKYDSIGKCLLLK